MFHHILVPLDGSKRAESALPVAASIARRTGARLLLLRVLPLPTNIPVYPQESIDSPEKEPGSDDYKASITYLARKKYAKELQDIPVDTHLITGPISQRILFSIETQAIDLVVMCSRGETGFKRWTLGSVAQKNVRHSPVPVLVLHESAGTLSNQHPAGQHPVRILVALDGSSLAETALEPAVALTTALSAPEPGALHLLCVLPPPRSTSAAGTHSSHLDLSEARVYMQTIGQAVREKRRKAGDLVIHISVVEGKDIAETIIRVAEEGAAGEACDAIALTSHGRGGLARWVMGSVAERLMYGTRLPLLVVHVPQPGDVEEKIAGERISVRARRL
jgi:nucleotide-binding universal stress UspA family protein